MSYAVGKKALGICDRCGFTYKLKELKYEVQDQKRTGSRICHNCFDPDQPQYQVGELNTSDNIGLYNPRPDTNEKGYATYYGFNPVNSTGSVIQGKVGQVKINLPPPPLPVGVNVPVNSNLANTTLGNATVDTDTTVSAVSSNVGTTALGNVTVVSNSAIIQPPTFAMFAQGYVGNVNVLTQTIFAVTVASYAGGNRFYIDGVVYPTLNLTETKTYRFDQSDSSNANHPIAFSTTANGTHGGGTEYVSFLSRTVVGTPGSAGAYTQITIGINTPTLYYYCKNHSGMGGQANTP